MFQMFLTFCENYGVPKTGLFQTVDLYEGRNMAQFLTSIQQLGTEVLIHLKRKSYNKLNDYETVLLIVSSLII